MKYKNFLIVLTILFSCISTFIKVKPSYAITCAPGDIIVDVCVNNKIGQRTVITANYTKEQCEKDGGQMEPVCLYGSDVVPGAFGEPISDPRANIRLAINVAMGFLGVLVVGMIIYGGVMWLTAAGKEEQVTKGKHVLMWAAIGAIVISIAWTITSYILQIGKTIG